MSTNSGAVQDFAAVSFCRYKGAAKKYAERVEQGLGKALPNKYDREVRRNFKF